MTAPRATVRPHGAARYRHGPDEHGTEGKPCRCKTCREAKRRYEARRSRLIAYGQWEGYLDAAGTRRRLQALMFNGWTMAKLTARLGVSRELEGIVKERSVLVYPATAEAVKALYDELWNRQPPQAGRYDRMGATRARRRALALGYQPAGAWDDEPGPHYIDDPAATPVPGCIRKERREWGALTEEAVELNELGEHVEMIAIRLGVKPETVERTLQRAGQAPWKAAA